MEYFLLQVYVDETLLENDLKIVHTEIMHLKDFLRILKFGKVNRGLKIIRIQIPILNVGFGFKFEVQKLKRQIALEVKLSTCSYHNV